MADDEAAALQRYCEGQCANDEVLTRALVRKPEPIAWEEATAKPVDVPEVIEEDSSGLTAH